MENFDKFSNNLLEEAKRFFEKARAESTISSKDAFLHASLLLAISSLEAYVNGIADDFKDADSLTLHEKGFLLEKKISLENGKFILKPILKMSRLIERIEFLFKKFDSAKLDKTSTWWGNLKIGISLRNSLVHPKEFTQISETQIKSTLFAVIECVNNLFLAIYRSKLPSKSMGIDSKLMF